MTVFSDNNLELHHASALDVYGEWETPTVILSDGAYGVGGFPGDPKTPSELADWYLPHIKAWTEAASSRTTLWFWNTEIGWASTHPVMEDHGWKYVSCNIWDKGISHVAGNSNTQTLRHFPKVTEVCVQYVREPYIQAGNEHVSFRSWLISEWQRSGLPFSEANVACGVKNAASRKYLTSGPEWYPPPPEMLKMMEDYLNNYGDPEGKPYLDLNQVEGLEGDWKRIRSVFHCEMGVTNVWRQSSPRGKSRVPYGKSTHPNQKPLKLVERVVSASSNKGDVVWEPFAGTAPAAVVSLRTGRSYYGAEISDEFFKLCCHRLTQRGLADGSDLLDDTDVGEFLEQFLE